MKNFFFEISGWKLYAKIFNEFRCKESNEYQITSFNTKNTHVKSGTEKCSYEA